jgi:(E)-4-hydroxy-3-methylbut-2-enyl-diphosphate synthase
MERRATRLITLGDVPIGGGSPITIQSMTNTSTADASATLDQVRELECAGCDIIRVAVPDRAAADALPEIIGGTSLPVVADIHFDYRLALLAMEKGAPGIRINPGTLSGADRMAEVAREAAARGVVVRVGVNAGSLERKFREGGARAEAGAIAASALEGVALLEESGVDRIKISVKASDVPRTIEAYGLVADRTDWPLHVGVTEAGTLWSGTIKSAVGIGALLAMGVGDTIRVSLTGPPVEEVRVGRRILAALALGGPAPEVISCPTCARAEIDVVDLAGRVEKALEGRVEPIRVAVMGCAVNGPGEAREADIGIAGGSGGGLLFVGGRMVRRVPRDEMVDALMAEVEKMLAERGDGGAS